MYSEILKADEYNTKYAGLNEKFQLGREYRGRKIVPSHKQHRRAEGSITSHRRSSAVGGIMKITLEELVESVG